ncbi:unnamed protein product [Phytophthora fragariaefolia]|uniref:Unnamed protein product n=1 Tax=Phytophthora fragariaefolia TaxID=1490495 RepID=A0A9W7CV42_9STRA|nr:unnamed protein product [Phytophthora fragariaefolia]
MRLSSIVVMAAIMLFVNTGATKPGQAQLSIDSDDTATMRLRNMKYESDDESEERMNSLKNVKIPNYLNHPLLAPEKQVVAAANAVEKTKKIAPADQNILNRLKSIDKGLERFLKWKGRNSRLPW